MTPEIVWNTTHPASELQRICEALAIKHGELANILAAEIDAKADRYFQSSSTSHAGKDAEATHATRDYHVQRVELQGEIDAFREAQAFFFARRTELLMSTKPPKNKVRKGKVVKPPKAAGTKTAKTAETETAGTKVKAKPVYGKPVYGKRPK